LDNDARRYTSLTAARSASTPGRITLWSIHRPTPAAA